MVPCCTHDPHPSAVVVHTSASPTLSSLSLCVVCDRCERVLCKSHAHACQRCEDLFCYQCFALLEGCQCGLLSLENIDHDGSQNQEHESSEFESEDDYNHDVENNAEDADDEEWPASDLAARLPSLEPLLPIKHMPFGMYKGMPVWEVPCGYVSWMCREPGFWDTRMQLLSSFRLLGRIQHITAKDGRKVVICAQ